MTVIVGANASGKSTIVEAIGFLQRPKQVPELGEGLRNSAARGRITIRFETRDHRTAVLGSDPSVGSEVTWRENTLNLRDTQVLVMPSRRALLQQLFQNLATERAPYVTALASATRGHPFQSFGGRLVRMNQNKPEIDPILTRVLGRPLHWTLEPSQSSGQVRLRVFTATGPHLGDGLADGLAALLFLADALYDSRPGDLIVLDEPELSLHPTAQRRLAQVLAEYAADRQIVCATHSPEFADWSFIFSGAQLVRTFDDDGGMCSANLDAGVVDKLRGLSADHVNPHVLGPEARRVFFVDEPVILVEGQEDVVAYRLLAKQLQINLPGEFYGWGVGGAGNVHLIARVLRSLGFRKVVAVLDADQVDTAARMQHDFAEYRILENPAADVRTKMRGGAVVKDGLLDTHWAVRDDQRQAAAKLLTNIARALQMEPSMVVPE